jgi:integrase
MSIRKRSWKTGKGEQKEAWIVDYVDQHGARHIKTFPRKKEADAYAVGMRVEVRDGTHTAPHKSLTVAEAGELWLETGRKNDLEQSTLDSYRQQLEHHIRPFLGRVRLADLSAPTVRHFEDSLRLGKPAPGQQPSQATARSAAMTKKILGSLGSILSDAQERGLVARNVARDLRSRRKRGKQKQAERRQKGKLKVSLDIPMPDEIRAMLAALPSDGHWRPFFHVAVFSGLRASELRGLRWADVDFKRGEINVRQRADRYHKIGRPKSDAGERIVPLPPKVILMLKEWKLRCPKGDLDLVLPNSEGGVQWHANIINRGFIPMQIAAKVTTQPRDAQGKLMKDEKGRVVVKAKYTGLHALRHFFASWCINRKSDGGLELPPKLVQERLGHSSITMTMDTYGHLFPRGDDGSELAAAESALLG